MTLVPPPAQKILEEQGYLICASTLKLQIGAVLEKLNGGTAPGTRFDHVPGPLVVIGETTKTEWLKQYRRYTGDPILPSRVKIKNYFYKVTAE